jgi:L-alanine-DL-glutamate epimerase-like enolase superfamily enzyme
MPACHQYHEWSIEDVPWTERVYEPMLRVVDGAVAVPTTPGWGVEILPEFLTSTTRQASSL